MADNANTVKFEVGRVSTTRSYEGTITIRDLRAAFNIPANAKVTVHVPGGGDWSHCDLEIEEHPINVSWDETEIKEGPIA